MSDSEINVDQLMYEIRETVARQHLGPSQNGSESSSGFLLATQPPSDSQPAPSALNLQPPASRYRMSRRAFPERLPEPQYPPGVQTRIVQQQGKLSYRGHDYRVPKAFRRQRVALHPSEQHDGIVDVFFFRQRIAQLNLHHQ